MVGSAQSARWERCRGHGVACGLSAGRTLFGGGFSGTAGEKGAADRVRSGCPRGGQQNAVRVSAGRTGQVVGSAQSARWEKCRGHGVACRLSAGWTAERSPSVRGADRFSGLGHPRVSVRAADRLSGWFSQTTGERVAADMVLHAGCPRGGIGERWMAAFF